MTTRTWEPWFAWHPVFTAEGRWVWLKPVHRTWVTVDCPWSVDLSGWQYSENAHAINT